MPNNIIKNVVFVTVAIVVCILVTAVFFVLVHWFDTDRKKYAHYKSWKMDTGTLIGLDHGGRGGASKFQYFFNNQQFEEYSKVNLMICGNIVGEKYKILVNPQYLNVYIPLDWQPIFTLDERTSRSKGTILEISSKLALTKFTFISDDSLASHLIVFSYDFENTNRTRCQALPPYYQRLYPALQIGQSYEVEYWDEDPRRAIMHLDKPIKDLTNAK